MDEGAKAGRDPILRTLAVLMALIAVSNFLKPIAQARRPESIVGFVFFGTRLEGTANAVISPIFGLILAVYAYGAWTRRAWVVPLALAFAVYVIVNLALFAVRTGPSADTGNAFGLVVYAAVAIGVSGGGALYLLRNRHRLR